MRAAEIAALKFAMSLLEDVFFGATKTRATGFKRYNKPRWWFQIFFIFTPIWGRFPF